MLLKQQDKAQECCGCRKQAYQQRSLVICTARIEEPHSLLTHKVHLTCRLPGMRSCYVAGFTFAQAQRLHSLEVHCPAEPCKKLLCAARLSIRFQMPGPLVVGHEEVQHPCGEQTGVLRGVGAGQPVTRHVQGRLCVQHFFLSFCVQHGQRGASVGPMCRLSMQVGARYAGAASCAANQPFSRLPCGMLGALLCSPSLPNGKVSSSVHVRKIEAACCSLACCSLGLTGTTKLGPPPLPLGRLPLALPALLPRPLWAAAAALVLPLALGLGYAQDVKSSFSARSGKSQLQSQWNQRDTELRHGRHAACAACSEHAPGKRRQQFPAFPGRKKKKRRRRRKEDKKYEKKLTVY